MNAYRKFIHTLGVYQKYKILCSTGTVRMFITILNTGYNGVNIKI